MRRDAIGRPVQDGCRRAEATEPKRGHLSATPAPVKISVRNEIPAPGKNTLKPVDNPVDSGKSRGFGPKMGGPRGDRADGSHPAAGVPSGLAWGPPGAASRAIHSTFITSIGRGAALSPSSFIGRRLSEALSRRRWRPTRCRHSGLTRYARSICARSARRSANAFGSCWTGQLRSRRPDWSLCFDASSNRNRKSRRQSRQPLKSLRQLSSYGGQIANPPTYSAAPPSAPDGQITPWFSTSHCSSRHKKGSKSPCAKKRIS
jgi:hypothetical protein